MKAVVKYALEVEIKKYIIHEILPEYFNPILHHNKHSVPIKLGSFKFTSKFPSL